MMQLTNKYRIDAKLGEGGMGTVFWGEMVGIEGFTRIVAIKMLRGLYEGCDPAHARFAREARICGTLRHCNVVSVLDFDRSDAGEPFLVMEYVDGADLRAFMKSADLSIDASVYIAAEVLRALAHAHECGVIHRDVKPRNVLISRLGEVKLTDFGLAKLDEHKDSNRAKQSTVKGTVGYIAPEIAKEEPGDHRADLFMIGVMLYELLTGQMPFGKQGLKETMKCMFDGPPKEPSALRPDVPEQLNTLILRLLRPQPDERHSNADEVRSELLACANIAHGADEIAALALAYEDPASAQASRKKKDSRATAYVELVRRHSDNNIRRMNSYRWRQLASVLAVAAVALLVGGMLLGRDKAWPTEVTETSAPLAAEAVTPAEPEPAPVVEICTPVAIPVESHPKRTTSPRGRPRSIARLSARPAKPASIPTVAEAPGRDPGLYPAEYEDLP